ncbi:trigger factor-like [Trichomycterus rosablanca]|uniref:trigger factor-like n=1 Tax=Trichomycterus rosablanca TaxID=2290929 RepID=UPI002F35D995
MWNPLPVFQLEPITSPHLRFMDYKEVGGFHAAESLWCDPEEAGLCGGDAGVRRSTDYKAVADGFYNCFTEGPKQHFGTCGDTIAFNKPRPAPTVSPPSIQLPLGPYEAMLLQEESEHGDESSLLSYPDEEQCEEQNDGITVATKGWLRLRDLIRSLSESSLDEIQTILQQADTQQSFSAGHVSDLDKTFSSGEPTGAILCCPSQQADILSGLTGASKNVCKRHQQQDDDDDGELAPPPAKKPKWSQSSSPITASSFSRKCLSQSPAAKHPAARGPAAKHTAAKHPAARGPAAKHPAAKHSAAKHPAAKYTAAKHPAAKHPAARDPAAKDPAAKDPAARGPEAKHPAAKHPAARGPAAKHPAARGPAVKHPVAKHPAAKDPAARDPAAKDPAAKDPAAKLF